MSRQGTSGATKMELTAIATHSGSDSDEEEVSPAQTISSLEGEVQPLKVQHPGVLQHGFRAYLCRSLRILLVGTPGDRPWLNALLLLVPFVFMSNSFGWGNGVTFALALLAICPFAERLNFVTEDLTKYTNATLGGLLNASFGNVTEMIVSIMAMRKGELWIIQASMLGSILSNLLLVLGSAFFVGGCRRHRSVGTGSILQKFNLHAANVNISLLLLCVAAFSLPSILVSDLAAPGWEALPSVDNVSVDATPAGKSYSVVAAVFLLLVYALYLLFQLKTHRDIFDDDDDDDDTDPPVLGFWGAMWWLGVATIFISFLSDILVDSFTSATGGIGIPDVFVWTILVPIVGNAAEHASAVIFAYVRLQHYCMFLALLHAYLTLQFLCFLMQLQRPHVCGRECCCRISSSNRNFCCPILGYCEQFYGRSRQLHGSDICFFAVFRGIAPSCSIACRKSSAGTTESLAWRCFLGVSVHPDSCGSVASTCSWFLSEPTTKTLEAPWQHAYPGAAVKYQQ